MNVEISGLFGLILLVANIWAILNIAQSGATTGKKVAWIVAILLLPLLGLIVWWLVGPRER